jgi:uncharacterized protein (TIGR02271 family)
VESILNTRIQSVERRPPSDRRYTSISAECPVDSQTEIKVPLKKEEVEVINAPYVKEEVVVKKKPVTETHQVNTLKVKK